MNTRRWRKIGNHERVRYAANPHALRREAALDALPKPQQEELLRHLAARLDRRRRSGSCRWCASPAPQKLKRHSERCHALCRGRGGAALWLFDVSVPEESLFLTPDSHDGECDENTEGDFEEPVRRDDPW